MNKNQKKRSYLSYIKKNYSEIGLTYLEIFKNNFFLFLKKIELDGVIISKLNKNEIKHNFDQDFELAVKHITMIDALSKVMMLIESFFIFNLYFKKNIKSLPKKMCEYRPNDVYHFIENIESSKFTWKDIWEIFAYPKINNLSLNKSEKKLVNYVLKKSSEHIFACYKEIINFYKNHIIIYNKFKHGLSFIAGLKQNTMDTSVYLALDRKEKRNKIKGINKCTNIFIHDFYNTFSIINYNNKSFKNISNKISELQNLVENLVENHFIRAFNCGYDYIPLQIMLNQKFPEEKYNKFKLLIRKKIAPLIYQTKRNIKTEIAFKKDINKKMNTMLSKFNVATFWTNPKRKNISKGKFFVKVN